MWWSYKPYVSAAQRRATAAKEVAKLATKGQTITPVQIEGRTIARTFWGKAWCDNLESYSDFENRLPRGRTYVRNGSVVDLQIAEGKVTALVSGSDLYRVKILIQPVKPKTWNGIRQECAEKIGSLIELLQGKLAGSVMQLVTRQGGGLFPSPGEIEMDCSCPDWAGMCKHVAATLYGVGNRLDHQPELLFVLRKVNHLELIAAADSVGGLPHGSAEQSTIAEENLAELFGIELEGAEALPAAAVAGVPAAKPVAPRRAGSPGKRQRNSAPVEADPPIARKRASDGKKKAATTKKSPKQAVARKRKRPQ